MIFFGTSNLAITVLGGLLEAGFNIKAVVTQPDKPAGRGKKLQQPPIKKFAAQHNISVLQFKKLDKAAVTEIQELKQELFLVAEYGLIIPQSVLDLPKHGTLNVHPSMLPKYRGATPLESALLDDLSMTGVSIMLLDAEMDHGPLLAQQTLAIEDADSYPTLEAKAGRMGAAMLTNLIPEWISGKITPQHQNHSDATFCKKIKREDGLINWKDTSQTIYNKFRAYSPWPGIHTTWKGKRLKLLMIRPDEPTTQKPGTVFVDGSNRLLIACGDGSLLVDELQLQGKNPADAQTFLNGYSGIVGTELE